MKKLLIVVLAVVMVCGAVFAQEFQPAAKAGAKSLNFTFFGLGEFKLNGTGPAGGLGLSYFMSNDAAFRLGVQLGIASSTIPANPPAGVTGTDGSTSKFQVGLSGDYLMYLYGMTPRVKPYAGLGISFAITSLSQKDTVSGTAVQTEVKGAFYHITGAGAAQKVVIDEQGGMTLGLKGILGAEFFLYPELSISAEYSLNLFSLNSPSDLVATQGPSSQTTKQTSSSQILGFGAAGAALHIYF